MAELLKDGQRLLPCRAHRASDGGRYNLAEYHCIALNIWLSNNGKDVINSWDQGRW
jgi:hypothetical protein